MAALKNARNAVETFLVEHARRDEDPGRPDDLPLRALRGAEQRHALAGPGLYPGHGVDAANLLTYPPQLGLGQQPQVGLGALVAHAPSLHPAGYRCRLRKADRGLGPVTNDAERTRWKDSWARRRTGFNDARSRSITGRR